MTVIHTTPQIVEVANFSMLRAMIITLGKKGLLSEADIKSLCEMAAGMCAQTQNEDPASSLGAAQLIESWWRNTFA